MNSILNLSAKSALVVGGSSGIGRGIAMALRDAGAQVAVWGTRPRAEDYDETSALTGLTYAMVDVTDNAAVAQQAAGVDRLDILVLSQGIMMTGDLEFEIDNFASVIALNLTSLMTCATGFRSALRASAGCIIVINSTAALHAIAGQPAYGASKTGALGLTRALARSWAREGIRVNAIAPGAVETKINKKLLADPARRAALVESTPIGRLTSIDEVASVALFLASPMAGALVGVTIPVDGGRHL
jgi:3-oxoacyl-[acyl-carrier protein] reductase